LSSLISRIIKPLLVVALVGAVSAHGVVATAEGDARARVLIIGDSVFDAFDHVASARRILNEQHGTILAVQGCQKLVEPGCIKSAKLSALDQLRKHSGQFTDAVVIGTGYNDRIGPAFRQAVLAITTEAASQGVDVIWITYRQIGHVRGNSTTRNKQLRKLEQNVPNLVVADWNAYSEGKEAKGWFRADRIHLLTLGANGLARFINESTSAVIARRAAASAVAGS